MSTEKLSAEALRDKLIPYLWICPYEAAKSAKHNEGIVFLSGGEYYYLYFNGLVHRWCPLDSIWLVAPIVPPDEVPCSDLVTPSKAERIVRERRLHAAG